MSDENTIDKVKLISELKEIHSELFQVYKRLFDFKYKHYEEFKVFIDTEYKENGVGSKDKKAWNDNFCHRASYTLLNKILFVRICEDKEFMRNFEDYIAGEVKDSHIGEKLSKIGLQKWNKLVTNYTFGELIKFSFDDMKKSYSNISLYKENKYEILNPRDEEFSLKYIDGDKDTKDLILDFENVLSNIIEKLDTNNFNFKYTDGNILGDVYEKFMDRETRKAIGQFYTPEFVIKYILKNTVEEADVVENPFVKVFDPACGSGHFLIDSYDILRKKFRENLKILREKYADEVYEIKRKSNIKKIRGSEYWQEKNLHYHLLKNCIYGVDIDDFAVQLTTINLLLKDFNNITDELNIIQCDSLVKWEKDYDWENLKKQIEKPFILNKVLSEDLFGNKVETEVKQNIEEYVGKSKNKLLNDEVFSNKESAKEFLKKCEIFNNNYDYVIGNPPYIGHKDLSKQYKAFLRQYYIEVFKDKSDISYCFIYRFSKKSILMGKLTFITSRYFIESPTGYNLRKYLKKNVKLKSILDFYGVRILDDIGIDPVIFSIENTDDKIQDSLIDVIKIKSEAKKLTAIELFKKLSENYNNRLYEKFSLNQSILKNSGWTLVNEGILKIINKIESISDARLDEICDSFQGIISGCDKAFVVKENKIHSLNLEKQLIKPWIKNSYIQKYNLKKGKSFLIYADLINDENTYPNSIKHISNYRIKLENRRECKRGVRKWYQLQWGRNIDLFENKKIIFPYKSDSNRFCIDEGSFFSADIYALIIKKSKEDIIDYYTLLGILNSKIYEIYFHSFAKKLGENLYDYYPNTVMRLYIPLNNNIVINIRNLVIKILNEYRNISGAEISICGNYKNILQKFIMHKYIIEKSKYNISLYRKKIEENLIDIFKFDDDDINNIKLNFDIEKIHRRLQILKYFKTTENIKLISYDPINKEVFECLNLDELYNYINEYFYTIVIDILKFRDKYMEEDDVLEFVKKACDNFDELIKILRNKDNTINSLQIVIQALNNNCDTWNVYNKNRKVDKNTKEIVRYDKNTFGLASWSDEIHKKYFMYAIEEYTVKNPNQKKANDILKLFTDLDIEDKQDYVDVIEEKIKRAFNKEVKM